MAQHYPVWFLEGNIQAYLDGDTGIVYDPQGRALYQHVDGKLRPMLADGVLTVAPDGRVMSENGNQAGFITNYQQFLQSSPKPSRTAPPSGGQAGASSSPRANKKKTKIWLVLLLIAAAVFYFQSRPSGPVYLNVRAAGAALKQALLNHEESVTFRYRSKTYLVSSGAYAFSGFGNNGDLYEAFRAATAHTGDPDEGDQLSLWAGVESGTMSAVQDKDGYIITIHAKLTYFTTKEQEEWLQAKIKTVVSGLRLEGKTEYEKVRAIYQWICTHVTYDYAHLGDESYKMQYTAYSAVHDGAAVCSGFAQLFYRMALTAGLDARIKLNDNHAWNLVKIGDAYYYCDSTWDSGVSESQYQYFLKGSGDFQLHFSSLPMPWMQQSPLTTVDSNLPVSSKAYAK